MEMIEFWVLGVIALYHAVLTVISKVSVLLKKEIISEDHFLYSVADFLEKIADFFNGNPKHDD